MRLKAVLLLTNVCVHARVRSAAPCSRVRFDECASLGLAQPVLVRVLARVHVCKLVCSDAFDRARMPADPHGPSDDGLVHAAVHVSHRAHDLLREDYLFFIL